MIVGIIQARMGSKRLAGKSMLPLAGRPLLYRFTERVKRAVLLDQVVLATTKKSEDDVLCKIAEELNISVFRGSENDLVERILQCAIMFNADFVVRLCADNPLIEPMEIDRLILHAIAAPPIFLYSNTHNIKYNGYPDGLGCEVYNIRLLKFLDAHVKDPECREHPHKYFYDNDLVRTIECPKELRGYWQVKLDVNTRDEYQCIKAIYDGFGHNDFHFSDYKELLNVNNMAAN